ncbi:MAG TPA: hypothetical protein VFP71_03770 [Candidatus Angelobacter sp.]|nr:hypothetical protein [Candidatus Angelobacter sp.]
MMLQKHVSKILLLVGVLIFLLPNMAAARKTGLTSSEPVSGLQMTISRAEVEKGVSKAPKFRVELRNAGKNDLILNLGIMLANGRKQYPNAIVLVLTDQDGKLRRLELRDPAVIAGRMDPLIVPLPVGSSYYLPVDLDKYWAAASREFDYKLDSGNYSLAAEFTGRAVSRQSANLDVKGIALMPYWEGTVTSNQLSFETPVTH